MQICGLQKLSLLDYPGKLAATVFTGGCNFRCPFCHNALLVLPENPETVIDEDGFFAFLETRKGKLDGVCVTGGEPLLHSGLADFLRKIKDLGFSVKLDTNGSFPDRLSALMDQGLLDYVAMDIKNSREKYGQTVGIPLFDTSAVEKSVALLKLDRIPYEFRTTLVQQYHTQADIESIGRWISGAARYYLQGFVDSGNLISSGLCAVSKEQTEKMLAAVKKYVETAKIRG